MTGLSFFRTSTSKVSSVTTLVAPTCDHTPLTCDSIIAAQRALCLLRSSRWARLAGVAARATCTVCSCRPGRPVLAAGFAQRSLSGFLAGQPALGVERGRAAGAGGGDGLPVGAVDDVAGREDALDGGTRRRLVDQQVAVGVGGELS